MLLGELKLSELPGILFEDNAGSIFLAQNKQVSKRTKHIDLKHHFIREFTENRDGIQQGKSPRSSLSLTRRISARRMLKLNCSRGTKRK